MLNRRVLPQVNSGANGRDKRREEAEIDEVVLMECRVRAIEPNPASRTVATSSTIPTTAAAPRTHPGVGNTLPDFASLIDKTHGTVDEHEVVAKASSEGSGDSSLFSSALKYVNSNSSKARP